MPHAAPDPAHSTATPAAPGVAWLQWLAAAIIVGAGLSLAAAHAPARIRMIGLFPIGVGLLTGFVLAWLRESVGLRSSLLLVIAAAVLIIGVQSAATWQRYRLFVEEQHRKHEGGTNLLEITRLMRGGQPPEDPEARRQFDLMQESFRDAAADRQRQLIEATSFRTFLQTRVRALKLSPPWPTVLAAGEILLATLAGTWWFARRSKSASSATTAETTADPPAGSPVD